MRDNQQINHYSQNILAIYLFSPLPEWQKMCIFVCTAIKLYILHYYPSRGKGPSVNITKAQSDHIAAVHQTSVCQATQKPHLASSQIAGTYVQFLMLGNQVIYNNYIYIITRLHNDNCLIFEIYIIKLYYYFISVYCTALSVWDRYMIWQI